MISPRSDPTHLKSQLSNNAVSNAISNILEHFLAHLCLASHKRDIGKQCRPRSDAEERSMLFALSTGISLKHGNNKTNQTLLLLEMDRSKELR